MEFYISLAVSVGGAVAIQWLVLRVAVATLNTKITFLEERIAIHERRFEKESERQIKESESTKMREDRFVDEIHKMSIAIERLNTWLGEIMKQLDSRR